MKFYRVCRVNLVAVICLILAMVATSSAQQDNDSRFQDNITQYIEGSLGIEEAGQGLVEQLDQRIREECVAVMRTSPSDLKKEEEWLTTLINNAEERLMISAKNYHYRGNLNGRGDSTANENFIKAETDFNNEYFNYLVIRCFGDMVTTCIEQKKDRLQEEQWIRASFTAKCKDPPPGITPHKYGRIEFQIFPDKSLKGTAYPKERTVGLQVEGMLMSDDSFNLHAPANRNTAFEVDGRISSYLPLRGSGTVWYAGDVDGYGRWECSGKWESK